MAKAIVVYDTKYGNTKRVAEEIIEEMREIEGMEASICNVKEVDLERVADSDVILTGSPNHMGRPARGIDGFIDRLGKLDLKARRVAVFDTYSGSNFEKVVKKMEKKIDKKNPKLKLIMPDLSIRVEDMKGPILNGELPKGRDFGRKIASKLK